MTRHPLGRPAGGTAASTLHTTTVFVLLILALLIGLAVGLGRGGSLDALGRVEVRRPRLLVLAVAALLLGRLVPGSHSVGHSVGWGVAMLLVAVFAVGNRRLPGLVLLLAGLALNTVVITVNDGRMPVSANKIERAGVPRGDITSSRLYVLADHESTLRAAGDVIPLALPGLPSVLSIGDMLIAAGLGLFTAVAPVRARRTLTARRGARDRATARTRRRSAIADGLVGIEAGTEAGIEAGIDERDGP